MIVNYVVADGKTNWFEGAILLRVLLFPSHLLTVC